MKTTLAILAALLLSGCATYNHEAAKMIGAANRAIADEEASK